MNDALPSPAPDEALASPPDEQVHLPAGITLPHAGDIVLFIPRPGEGRGGLREFPALVMKRNTVEGTIDLFVFFGLEDYGDRARIPHTTPDHPFPAWRQRDGIGAAAAPGGAPVPVAPWGKEPAMLELEERLNHLSEALFGPFERPAKSAIEFLADFEEKLRDLTKRVRELERAKG